MDKGSIIDIIQLASIIITGGLGIAGTITHTKDNNGKLTGWGKITVAGIMLANSFSFVQSYLKQKQEQTDQIVTLKKEKDKEIKENSKYRQTIALLNNNIHKSDSSLSRQMVIQEQSSKLLTQVNQSITIQNKTFKQSEVLNTQQHDANEEIERTLNPLLPFKIDLNLLNQSCPQKPPGLLYNFVKIKYRQC